MVGEELYLGPKWRQKQCFSHAILKEIQDLEYLCRGYPDDLLIGFVNHQGNTVILSLQSLTDTSL